MRKDNNNYNKQNVTCWIFEAIFTSFKYNFFFEWSGPAKR